MPNRLASSVALRKKLAVKRSSPARVCYGPKLRHQRALASGISHRAQPQRERRAYERGEARSEFWENAHTVASGLRVPKPLGDFLILDAVRQSSGTAVAVSDSDMLDAGIDLATEAGIFAAPEGGACVAALHKLLKSGFLDASERIVIYNTGSGLKYLEAYSTRFPRTLASEQDKLGGLITPR